MDSVTSTSIAEEDKEEDGAEASWCAERRLMVGELCKKDKATAAAEAAAEAADDDEEEEKGASARDVAVVVAEDPEAD